MPCDGGAVDEEEHALDDEADDMYIVPATWRKMQRYTLGVCARQCSTGYAASCNATEPWNVEYLEWTWRTNVTEYSLRGSFLRGGHQDVRDDFATI
jgi:hypothetical protein